MIDYIGIEEFRLKLLIEDLCTGSAVKWAWVGAITWAHRSGKELKFKEGFGDGPNIIFHAETTDRLLGLWQQRPFLYPFGINLPVVEAIGRAITLNGRPSNASAVVDIRIFDQRVNEIGRHQLQASGVVGHYGFMLLASTGGVRFKT